MIKGIIFDFDGTIVDTNELILKCLLLTAKNISNIELSKKDIETIYGRSLTQQMEMIDKTKILELANYYKKMYFELMDNETFLFKGIKELIINLHNMDIKLAILTNKSTKGVNHGLELFNLKDYFHEVISMDDVNLGKPNNEGLIKLLNKLNLKNEEVLIIGDSEHDIEVGINNDIISIMVGWSFLSVDKFKTKPSFIIDKPNEIIDYINKENKKENS
ncbi:MAG: HAD-IA family hydrolase [Bacillota bacterium]|nr:HAD-IA family hydrolase [Bacillota bacterium]